MLAQDIAGTWQGTLQAGKELRLVFKISKGDGSSLKATMYRIDQGGQVVPGGAVAVQGGMVKMPVPGIGAVYEGKLNPEANLISGTWTQGSTPLPLNVTRATEQRLGPFLNLLRGCEANASQCESRV